VDFANAINGNLKISHTDESWSASLSGEHRDSWLSGDSNDYGRTDPFGLSDTAQRLLRL
jgi:hypothetical protein